MRPNFAWVVIHGWLWQCDGTGSGSGPAETRLDQVASFVEPDACAASACCSSFVQKAEAEEHKTLSTSGTWYFLHGGSEESVTAIVPAETVLASTPAVVHGWCMKWKETASGTKPYLDQASSERTCARGTAYMLSEPGARLYETFWTGPAQPLADPQSLSFTAPSGQILKATVLVPKLPLTEEAPQYFSAIWFEACETEEEFTTVSS
ncbi:hypothetical protein AK812_SmicGene22044 [Symbiodinium microadriaticum]|uniref:Uncharacterized protein n=1 Tax=Symbiodinium microadriaticum TaxID=2951 RepID=A0A1Q9DKS3_SYMMI|nr:hypothetical protein AK812_SmicGene22044 [Symbiodinium microadriaticum]